MPAGSGATAVQRALGAALTLALSAAPAPATAAGQEPPPVPSWESLRGGSTVDLGTRRRAEIEKALAARDWARAETLLVAEIERTPKPAALLKVLAGVFMNDRKPLNAAIAIKKAEAFGPLDEPTRFQLAMAYIALRRGDWARPELERLAADDPANTAYQYWLARLDYDAGRYAAAAARLGAVVQREPAFVRAYDNLGLCYEALHRLDEADRQYREAIRRLRETGEKWPWPFLNLGILLGQRGEVDQAEALFREALSADPAFAPALYHLGTILEQTGRVDAAIESLRRAAEADSNYAEPHFALARIYRRQGRTADADLELAAFQRLHQSARAEGR